MNMSCNIETEDNDDWDDAEEEWHESKKPIESLSKKDMEKVEWATLEALSKEIDKKEIQAKSEGFEGYKGTFNNGSLAEFLAFLNQKMDTILAFYKGKHPEKYPSKYPKKKDKRYDEYPDDEMKLSLRDQVIEKLSKEDWWDSMSPQGRENETRKEMLKKALDSRGQENLSMEKAIVGEHEIISMVDDGYAKKTDPVDGIKLEDSLSWAEYMEYMDRKHTELMDKYYFLVASLFPKRITNASKYSSAVRSQTIALPEGATMSKEQLSKVKAHNTELEELSKSYPNASREQLERLLALRRQR